MQYLSERIEGRDNYLTFMRLCLASAVLLEHSWQVVNGVTIPSFLKWGDHSLAHYAVNGFFVLSGVLIAQSLDRQSHLIRYFESRLLRIMPALIVLALSASLIIGPFFTSLPLKEYVLHPDFWLYPLNVITFADTGGAPPEVFQTTHDKGVFGSTLWTLRYEMMAYIGAALAASLGVLHRKSWSISLLCLSFVLWTSTVIAPDVFTDLAMMDAIPRFAATFLLGVVFYAWRQHIAMRLEIALICMLAAMIATPTVLHDTLSTIAIGYGLIYLGYFKSKKMAYLKTMPDYSYGIYIWSWPIMQMWVASGYEGRWLGMLGIAACSTVLLAALSWHIIEKPSLALKGNLFSRYSGLISKA